jgi:hypothetical protein
MFTVKKTVFDKDGKTVLFVAGAVVSDEEAERYGLAELEKRATEPRPPLPAKPPFRCTVTKGKRPATATPTPPKPQPPQSQSQPDKAAEAAKSSPDKPQKEGN